MLRPPKAPSLLSGQKAKKYMRFLCDVSPEFSVLNWITSMNILITQEAGKMDSIGLYVGLSVSLSVGRCIC